MKSISVLVMIAIMSIITCGSCKKDADILTPKTNPVALCGNDQMIKSASFIEYESRLITKVRLGGPWLDPNGSRPRIFFLNFHGRVVEETPWNNNGPFTTQSWAVGQDTIDKIVTAVQLKFARWNVFVTADSIEFATIKGKFRQEVILTSIVGLPFPPAGGYAMIGSLYAQDNVPAFVFHDLWNNDVANIIGALEHELGHAIGLHHQSQCVGGVMVYPQYPVIEGTNFSVARVMGNFANADILVWAIGQTEEGCTFPQDDIQWFGTYLGALPDDHEGVISPSTVQVGVNTPQMKVILNNLTDVDVLYIPNNHFTFEIISDDVDVKVIERRADGTMIGSPIDPLGSTSIPLQSVNVPSVAGVYLEIQVSPNTGTTGNPTPINTAGDGIILKVTQ